MATIPNNKIPERLQDLFNEVQSIVKSAPTDLTHPDYITTCHRVAKMANKRLNEINKLLKQYVQPLTMF